jgi:hypothetical protein
MLLRLRGSRENVTPFALLTIVALWPSAHNQSQFPQRPVSRLSHSLVISHARSPGIVAAILCDLVEKITLSLFSRSSAVDGVRVSRYSSPALAGSGPSSFERRK